MYCQIFIILCNYVIENNIKKDMGKSGKKIWVTQITDHGKL